MAMAKKSSLPDEAVPSHTPLAHSCMGHVIRCTSALYNMTLCSVRYPPTHPPAAGTRAARVLRLLRGRRWCACLRPAVAGSSTGILPGAPEHALASPHLEGRGARVASRPSWTAGLTPPLGRSWP